MKSTRYNQRQKYGRKKVKAIPEPEEGINRVSVNGDVPIFQLILGQYLSNSQKQAVWIDSGNKASTYALSSAGGPDLLQRVHVGRAFTAFQHFHIVNRIEEFLEPETEYIVLPNIDQQYRTGNVSEKEVKDLFSDLIAKIRSIREERPEIKILYSFFDTGSHEINAEMRKITENSIEIERNSQGLKSKSDAGKNLCYRKGSAVQTTIPFWKRENHEKPKNTVKIEYDGKNKQHV